MPQACSPYSLAPGLNESISCELIIGADIHEVGEGRRLRISSSAEPRWTAPLTTRANLPCQV